MLGTQWVTQVEWCKKDIRNLRIGWCRSMVSTPYLQKGVRSQEGKGERRFRMICIWTNMNKTTICKTHRHRHDMLFVYSNAHFIHYIYCTCIMYTHHIKYTVFHGYHLFFKPPTPLHIFLKGTVSPGDVSQHEADQKLVFQNLLLEDQAKPFEVLCEFEYIIQCLGAFFGFFLVPRMGKIPSQHPFFLGCFSVPA